MSYKEYTVRVYDNGTKCWYLNGNRHREDGPAVEYPDGYKAWLVNGLLHREDGPAVELPDGDKFWYLNNQLHREDGPAVENANGSKYWYLNGNLYTEEAFKKKLNPVKELNINYSAFQTKLNPFTEQIATGVKELVKLRNGIVARPVYYPHDDDGNKEYHGFRQQHPMMYWNADGTSITRSDYDMISFVDSLEDFNGTPCNN